MSSSSAEIVHFTVRQEHDSLSRPPGIVHTSPSAKNIAHFAVHQGHSTHLRPPGTFLTSPSTRDITHFSVHQGHCSIHRRAPQTFSRIFVLQKLYNHIVFLEGPFLASPSIKDRNSHRAPPRANSLIYGRYHRPLRGNFFVR